MALIKHGTLTAATVTTVVLDAVPLTSIEVTNVTGASAIYFTIDGSTPTVAGDNCHVLPAAIGAFRISAVVPLIGSVEQSAPTVKLISGGTPGYCVEGTP